MQELIREYFSAKRIEYFAVADYRDCTERRPDIVARAGFLPRSAVIYLAPYYVGPCDNLSVYAASEDYHRFLRQTGEGLAELLRESAPGACAAAYGDHSPIDERRAAAMAGLGVIGDNGLLINERYGSYVFIGEVLTDLPPERLGGAQRGEISGCEHCGACRRACPTGRIGGESDECVSEMTQRKGELSPEAQAMIKGCGSAWGCDLCQTACPHNRSPVATPIGFFASSRISHLDKEEISAMSEEEFSARAFAWRGRATVIRNLELTENK